MSGSAAEAGGVERDPVMRDERSLHAPCAPRAVQRISLARAINARSAS